MSSNRNYRDESFNLNGLRSVLFTAAKRWWGIGLIIGYLASLIMPVTIYFDFKEKWLGAIIAILLSIIGKMLRWKSDSIRGSADLLHRANELSTGIGHPVDPTMIANIRSRYHRFIDKAREMEKEQDDYYEERGTPSPRLLLAHLRESAWWTTQLAATAKKVIYTGTFIVLLPVFISIILADSMLVRVYVFAISVIILIDMFYLGIRFGKLETDCHDAFKYLNDLVNKSNLTDREAVICATSYQIVRSTGPLVPDWLRKYRRNQLQAAWKPLSMVRDQ